MCIRDRVTGGSGGGKTSVSRAILSNFPDEKIAMIEHDSYYKDCLLYTSRCV